MREHALIHWLQGHYYHLSALSEDTKAWATEGLDEVHFAKSEDSTHGGLLKSSDRRDHQLGEPLGF